MKKKILALLLIIAVVATMATVFVGCNKRDNSLNEVTLPAFDGVQKADYSGVDFSKIKVGLICLHDKNSTYDKNFIVAMEIAQKELGLKNDQVLIATGIPEGEECYTKACEFAEAGCNIIFADSFGHEPFVVRAAKRYPNVQFCHATGTQAHTEQLANYANAFASIYEGRYLAGVAAGMKLQEMIEGGKLAADKAVIGYVGAYPYAEVKSGYTSFFLGARSVCPSATMKVVFTNSWYDVTAENQSAKFLINQGCKLISQHADSMGAPNACEEAGIPNVAYNGSTLAAAPDTFIVSSRINWTPYYEYAIAQKAQGKAVATDWTGTIATGSVELSNLGGNAMAEGTVEKIVELRAKLAAGTLNVFDLSTFTVGGKALTNYIADVDDYGEADFWAKDTEVVENGIFKESKFRSAPYFDIDIDGITILEVK